MKKLLLFVFILTLSAPTFAGLDVKQVIGSWKYSVQLDQGQMTGILKFVESEGKLTGKVISDEGDTFPMTKVEIKEDNTLYFELKPEYDVFKITLKVDGNKFKGSGSTPDGEFYLTGEKQK